MLQEAASTSLATLAANPQTLVARKQGAVGAPGLVVETRHQARPRQRKRRAYAFSDCGRLCGSDGVETPTAAFFSLSFLQADTQAALLAAASASRRLDEGAVAGQPEVRRREHALLRLRRVGSVMRVCRCCGAAWLIHTRRDSQTAHSQAAWLAAHGSCGGVNTGTEARSPQC